MNESVFNEVKDVLISNGLTLDKNTIKQNGKIQGVIKNTDDRTKELLRADVVISFYDNFKELEHLRRAFEKQGFKTDTNLHS